MHTTTKQLSVEARILRALPGVLKDVGRAVPHADWADLKDAAMPDVEFCEEMFLDVLVGMAKDGSIVFDEDFLLVSLPVPPTDSE